VGDRPLCEFPKTSPVVTHGVALKHWQHARASAIDNGDSGQEGRSHIERQDRSSGRGQACGFAPPDAAMISNMSVKQFIENVKPDCDTFVVRIKIDFRYTDVFAKDWMGETFYAGLVVKQPLPLEEVRKGISPWVGKISPMPKPRDWDDIGKAQKT
jgi:hypothetical protein